MSAQIKSGAKKAGKIVGIALFVFLMFFNIKFAAGDSSNGDIDLFGLKVTIFTPSAYATGCIYCQDVGCFGGTTLCAQFQCKGTLVQCFTQGGYGT